MLTLGQAARLTGLGKTTLARAIRAGRLSAGRKPDGGYEIDPAELSRVYPFPAPGDPETVTLPVATVHRATPDATTDVLVATLRQTIEDLRRDRDDARAERDHWRDQAQRLALPKPKPEPEPEPEPMTWWRWLRSTG
jgi:hypothetical protein